MSNAHASTRLRAAGLSLLLFLSACGDGAAVEDARYQASIGNLDVAERFLGSASSPAAEAVRAEIRAARAEREAIAAQVEELSRLSPAAERAELERLLEHVDDPLAKERIEIALSASADRAAEERSGRGHRAVHPFGHRLEGEEAPQPRDVATTSASPEVEAPRQRALDEDGLAASRAAIRAQVEAREWSRALSELEMALGAAGERAGELRGLRRDVLDQAEAEATALVAQAEQADDRGELEGARDLLLEAAERFPSTGAGSELRRALDDYELRLELLALADEPVVPRPRGAGDSANGAAPEVEPGARGVALERGGDLAGALDAYLEAGLAALPGPERDGWIAKATALERRLLLRSEILAARALSPEEFESKLGLLGGDTQLLQLEDGPVSWGAFPLRDLRRAAELSKLSQEAKLGLLDERLLRGDVAGASGALATLARYVKDGVVDELAAWDIVAAQRGEPVPQGGYVWQRGAWISRQDVLDAAEAEALALLTKKFKKAKDAATREALWAELGAIGGASRAARTELLEARWEKSLAAARKGSTLSALERVATARLELDQRRVAALELIFDEEEYFYPYRPPECPPEKARLYWPVQQRVDVLVAAVREVWEGTRAVKLPGSFREGLADLEWAQREGHELGLALALPAELPSWIFSLPTELDEVGLAEFAWDASERDQLAHDRAVEAYNERVWADQGDLPEAQTASGVEQRQVVVTNAYRKMFGRRAVAWNPKIQAAAEMHSDYMANTGDFGHFEQGDPERRSPFDRMRLAGYKNGVSENCHMGSGSAEGAHDGWCHSSGHHRNLLMPGHREMASALTSSYWTQNFGTGRSFEADLITWQD